VKTVANLLAARAVNFRATPSVAVAAAAEVVKTAKGMNLKRLNVYGYDTNDGRVPKTAFVVLVPGFLGVPKGVKAAAWTALTAMGGKPVLAFYDAYAKAEFDASSAVRRAYRAGAIRFATVAPDVTDVAVTEPVTSDGGPDASDVVAEEVAPVAARVTRKGRRAAREAAAA
jgi:hypothetical protein